MEYEFRDSMTTRLEKGYILPNQMDILYSLPQVLHKLQQYPLVLMTTLDVAVKDIAIERKFFFQVQASPSYNNGKGYRQIAKTAIPDFACIGLRDKGAQIV